MNDGCQKQNYHNAKKKLPADNHIREVFIIHITNTFSFIGGQVNKKKRVSCVSPPV
jgi:hypothetical protein